ncbi:ribonucleoside-diphosphate reductase subunit alpha [Terriglobus aquaticus]|uniref:Ribonucleoside-diphosphate reductase n=1 Tax=Terriglobus aquaticus TaxID=940139 RepID=A0ABW9KIN1_9BACT|nr:ribonucleoside-diphosphate reductase subunit alpha [Terriglobus aquaticus]
MATTTLQTSLSDINSGFPSRDETPVMHVKKRNGSLEAVDVNKIVRAVQRCAFGLQHVDAIRIASKTIGGLYDGATTRELDTISIDTAAALIAEEPQYSKLAARLLLATIIKEVANQNLHSFSQSVEYGFQQGIVSDATAEFVRVHARKLNHAIDETASDRFEYFGLRTVYDRYLLRDPLSRKVIETPQHFFLRVACGLAGTPNEAIEFYKLIAAHEYMPSSPTLFNSGTRHPQMSSCYLHDSPGDSLESIYDAYKDVALLSKFSGGIGLAFHRVRSEGSLIRATNGLSNGIVPWLRTLDSSVAAVNQGGKRKGACCVYLEPWHADVENFLELRENTGDLSRRTYNLNTANWIPDLFMKRVDQDGLWSLFDPKVVPHLPDLFGPDFDAAYEKAEEEKLYSKQMKARDLYAKMMRCLAETGNGWMTFKDACNLKNNQTGGPGNVIHLSNLCTEITEVTSSNETAVCNLGSINLGRHTTLDEDGRVVFDFAKLANTVRIAVPMLDRVIDINFYPIQTAADANNRWRPVGLGVMGLQDVFFQMRLPFDSPEAQALSARIQEEIYYHALVASVALAEKAGPHASFHETRLSKGQFQFDLWNVKPTHEARWNDLRERVAKFGVRNSLLIAIAPTATIASIVGCYECIEPQISNLFKRETLSGEFLQVNRYLIDELKARGMWNDAIRTKLKIGEGSIQNIDELPDDLKLIYRTVWEVPMRSLIEMAAARNAYVDQAQSLNLFVESPNIGRLSSMYMFAWKAGLKTTYYLRSRPATKIAKTTVQRAAMSSAQPLAGVPGTLQAHEPKSSEVPPTVPAATAEAIACSLENPESCEACQ